MFKISCLIIALLLHVNAQPTPPRQSMEEKSSQRRRLLGLEAAGHLRPSEIDESFATDDVHFPSSPFQEEIRFQSQGSLAGASVLRDVDAEVEAENAAIRERFANMTREERKAYLKARRDAMKSMTSQRKLQERRNEAMQRISRDRVGRGSSSNLAIALRSNERNKRNHLLNRPWWQGESETAGESDEEDSFAFEEPR